MFPAATRHFFTQHFGPETTRHYVGKRVRHFPTAFCGRINKQSFCINTYAPDMCASHQTLLQFWCHLILSWSTSFVVLVTYFSIMAAHARVFRCECGRKYSCSTSESARVTHYRCRAMRFSNEDITFHDEEIKSQNILWVILSHKDGWHH